jgi:C4-dicarboxylate transporter
MPSAEGRINVFNGISAAVSFSSMADEYAGVVGFVIACDLLAMLPS